MISLTSMTQSYIRGSVKKSTVPAKINIVFKPPYSSIAGEYVNYFQFSLAIPLAGKCFCHCYCPDVECLPGYGGSYSSGPFIEGSELVFNFGFLNPSPPDVNHYTWTDNNEFTGVVVIFNTANAALVEKMVDMTNSDFGFGCANGNSLYGIITNTGDKIDFAILFYAIPGQCQLTLTLNPGSVIPDQ